MVGDRIQTLKHAGYAKYASNKQGIFKVYAT